MSLQVFDSEQDAVDYAERPEFALLCLTNWGLSPLHASEVVKRMLRTTEESPLSASDAGWAQKIIEARASFVRMEKPSETEE